MNAIANWFDERTGYRKLVNDALYESIPGGSRWRYVWGSTLVFTFTVQVVTGIFLWMAYSPSSQTAWESVYYIQHEMQFGWLLRGIHHFTAQLMVVLLALHLMQVIIDGAYKAPREVNFWLGLILMQIVLGLSLTGYLLPWHQRGYWATQVATKLAGIIPEAGPAIQRLIVGGPEYGHHTLTRFFAMHAGLLPGLLIVFLVLHIYVFRRHGILAKDPQRAPDATFWPDQILKDAVACLGVLLVVLLLCFWNAPHSMSELRTLAEQDRLGDVLGAEMGAPADPADDYSAARPEWYFLFLFQFLKYFPGPMEFYGAVVIPGAVLGFMFLMPFIGRWKLGHFFNVAYVCILVAGVGLLTFLAIDEDRKNEQHVRAVADADAKADRIVELIRGQAGISAAGARELLRSDPKTHGPKVFAQQCAHCHRFDGHDGTETIPTSPATASDLNKFGTREWIRGFIENPAGPHYFGPTANASIKGEPVATRFTEGEMANWAKENVPKMQQQELDGVVEFLVAQGKRADIDPVNEELAAIGRNFFAKGSDNASACADCHHINVNGEALGEPGGDAPELTGYGSAEWLRDFVLHPGAENHYGQRNAMRPFAGQISDKDFNLVTNWLRHNWYEPKSQAKGQ
ncbi:MAG: cytochrome b N-terminal domain-containing protein [Planctomycetaceae bacterium]